MRASVLAAFVVLAAAAPAGAVPTWRNIGPGGGGWLPTVAVSPVRSGFVYAGCDVGGIFLSADSGATWHPGNTGLHDYYVEVIVPHPRDSHIVYLGTQGGVHKSTDGGKTWQWLREGFPPPERDSYSAPIGALAISPQHPDTLYAGVGRPRSGDYGRGTVYRTEDGGAHWAIANPGGGGMEAQAIVSELAVHPREGRTVYAATDRGLYRSDDAGATWRRLARGLPAASVRRVALCASHPERMYVTVRNAPGHQPWEGGVYRSDDGGEQWRPAREGLPTTIGRADEPAEMTSLPDRLVMDPQDPDTVYVGDASWVSAGVYRSRDGGASWQRVTDLHGPTMQAGWITFWGPSVMGLALDPRAPDTLYFSTSGQLYRTTDGGEHWKAVYTRPAPQPANAPDSPPGWWSTTGLEVTCLNDIAVHPSDPRRLFFCYFDIGLLQSFDGGRSFTRTVAGMRYDGNTFTVAFDPDDPRVMYAGTGEWASNHGDVCRSDDGGFTWKVVGKPETGLPDGQTRAVIVDRDSPRESRRIYATVNEAGVFCSEDGGASWHGRNDGLPGAAIVSLVQHPHAPEVLFALIRDSADARGGVYRSDDRGLHWKRVSGDAAWPDPQDLVICPSDPDRLYLAAREHWSQEHGASSGGVFTSSDGGASWRRVLEDRFIAVLTVNSADASVIYAGGTDHPYHDDAIGSGVMCSRDGGATWSSLNTPSLANHTIDSLTLDSHHPGRLYVGTGGNGAWVGEVR